MATAIEGITTGGGGECSGMHIPEEALTITGDCSNKFSNNGWLWFLEEAGDELTIKDISNTEDKAAVEIWIETDNGVTVLYFFNYDGGVIECAI
jgi:hypothetical protein